MESLRLALEIAGGLILVGGFLAGALRWIKHRAKAYIAPTVIFTSDFCTVEDEMLAVRYSYKRKDGRPIGENLAGLYEFESISSGHVVAEGWIEEPTGDGTSGRFLASVTTRDKEFSDFERLRPFVRDASGDLFFGCLIDPDELRAAFEANRNDGFISAPPRIHRAPAL